ncbi:MAG: hypothetical protein GX288_00940 [Clostridiales bacterium]|nr:hypothetical protein [Clostridiales bacterium]
MKQHDDIDKLLKEALAPMKAPSHELNRTIKKRIMEDSTMKISFRKPIPIPLLAAILTLLVSVSAMAAWHMLSPKEVAQKFGDTGLAQAFLSEDAVEINETISSGGYNISLLGIVSGEGLSDFKGSAHDIYPERTYAVVAISKEDNTPLPSTSDDAYGDINFFVSPLIKGVQPWLYNIVTMNGSYTETVIDGVMYRLIECDAVEIFADRGLYLCVSDTIFYSTEAYNYDVNTGEISPNPNYQGVNVLFNLPLDPSKANPEEAEKYLREILSEDEDIPATEIYEDLENLDALMESAVLIPESVKEVTYTESGSIVYEFEDSKLVCDVSWIFAEGQTGFSEAVSISEDDNEKLIRRFHRDEDGVITGMVYRISLND